VVLATCVGVMAGFGSPFVYTFAVLVKPLSAEFGCSREAISSGFAIAAVTVGLCSLLLAGGSTEYLICRQFSPAWLDSSANRLRSAGSCAANHQKRRSGQHEEAAKSVRHSPGVAMLCSATSLSTR
jgi:hypothetical protein